MFSVEQMYDTIFQPFLFLEIFGKWTEESGNRTEESEKWTEDQY